MSAYAAILTVVLFFKMLINSQSLSSLAVCMHTHRLNSSPYCTSASSLPTYLILKIINF